MASFDEAVPLRSGSLVMLRGLQLAPQLNGEVGHIVGDHDGDRYKVALRSGETKAVKTTNLVVGSATTTSHVLSAGLSLKMKIDRERAFLNIPGISVRNTLSDWQGYQEYVLSHSGLGAKILVLGMNQSNLCPVPFEDTYLDSSGSRVNKCLRQLWGQDWKLHAFPMNYSPLAFLGPRAHMGMADLEGMCSSSDCAESFSRIQHSCDRHLVNVVNAMGIRLVVALGRYSELRARTALERLPGSVHIIYMLHPSPKTGVTPSDWVNMAQERLHALEQQCRIFNQRLGSLSSRREERVAPTTPIRRIVPRHTSPEGLSPEPVARSRSPRNVAPQHVDIAMLRRGLGPSSLKHVLMTRGRVVHGHSFGQGGGQIRLQGDGLHDTIDCKFVEDASHKFSKRYVGRMVQITGFKLVRIGDKFLRYAPPGAKYRCMVTDVSAEVLDYHSFL
jgi:hypothetical protein